MYKNLFLATLLVSCLHTPSVQAAQPAAEPVAVLVHVVRLNALGPDDRPVTLYHNEPGLLTTLVDLARVTYQVQADALPDGTYHTLSVDLADQATMLYADGRQDTRSLTRLNIPTHQRIPGMLWVEEGSIHPLRTPPRTNRKHGQHTDDD